MNNNDNTQVGGVEPGTQAFKERSAARVLLVQMLYEWQMSGESPEAVFSHRSNGQRGVDYVYLKQVYFQVIEQIEAIDQCISPKLDRQISRLNPIELSILRLAAHELRSVFEVPYRVVIDEAVELTKQFGAQDGYKYVNAVLDKLAVESRKSEISG